MINLNETQKKIAHFKEELEEVSTMLQLNVNVGE